MMGREVGYACEGVCLSWSTISPMYHTNSAKSTASAGRLIGPLAGDCATLQTPRAILRLALCVLRESRHRDEVSYRDRRQSVRKRPQGRLLFFTLHLQTLFYCGVLFSSFYHPSPAESRACPQRLSPTSPRPHSLSWFVRSNSTGNAQLEQSLTQLKHTHT